MQMTNIKCIEVFFFVIFSIPIEDFANRQDPISIVKQLLADSKPLGFSPALGSTPSSFGLCSIAWIFLPHLFLGET